MKIIVSIQITKKPNLFFKRVFYACYVRKLLAILELNNYYEL